MKLDSLRDMIADYEKHTGEVVDMADFFIDDNGIMKDEYNTYFKYFHKKGFLFFDIREHDGVKYLELLQTYGYFKYMADFVKEVMRMNGIEYVLTATTRNPKAHCRKWKMERMENLDYDYRGKKYYVIRTHYDNVH